MVARGERGGELWQAVRNYKQVLVTLVGVSAALNVLLLGGSIYMMLVYDSVLPSHSIPSLVGLLALLMVVYLFQGFFDAMRSGMLADVASLLDRQLSRRVQEAISQLRLAGNPVQGDGLTPMRDLEQVRTFLSGGVATLIDLPWIVFFLAILAALHLWLGFVTLLGAIVIFSLTLFTNRAMKDPSAQIAQLSAYRNGLAEANLRHVELYAAMGMRGRMQDRFDSLNRAYAAAQNNLNRTAARLGGLSRIMRLALQSIILTVGALLVIDGKASGGVIFASSILSSRALAPVDQAIANWKNFMAARSGWNRLGQLLAAVGPEAEVHTRLPAPTHKLEVEPLHVGAPGSPAMIVHGVQFALNAGEACGVIGPSGAGKSTLGRALMGIWRAARGSVRLDGAALDQWRSADRGAFMGYLPQTVELLEGTIAENIARFDPGASSDAVIAAARAAGVHDLVTHLPKGYDTRVGRDGEMLSGGQRQRIGLARALYGDPFLVLLDEPNSNLDAEGEAALEQAVVAIRARGGIAVVISHRPGILGKVSHVMVMQEGRMMAFGPAAEILSRVTGKLQPVPAVTRQAAGSS